MKNVTFHVQYTLFGAPLILVLQHAVSKCVFFFFFFNESANVNEK